MLTPDEIKVLKKKYLPANMIWVSFLMILLISGLVSKSMQDSISGIRIDSFTFETIKFSLIGASMAILILIFLLRTAMLDSSKFGKQFKTASGKKDLDSIGARYLTTITVSMALSELICIFGITLFFIYKNEVALYQFMVFSGVAMLYFKPRRDEILEFARGMEKGSDKYIKNSRIWDSIE